MTSPSEAVFECLLVFNQSGDGLASFSGAYRTRKSFGWPSLSSKSLCKSSLFFTFIFQSMGRYTWERGRYQFAMSKKKYWFCIWIIDIFLTFQRFCRYIPMLIEALSCKISEKLAYIISTTPHFKDHVCKLSLCYFDGILNYSTHSGLAQAHCSVEFVTLNGLLSEI